MTHDLIGFDVFTLKGDALGRALAALKVARDQVQCAICDTTSWRVEAVLANIEDDLRMHLRGIKNAVDDDAAEAEETGEAGASRQAWLPLRAA